MRLTLPAAALGAETNNALLSHVKHTTFGKYAASSSLENTERAHA
jgi:hypothetical protein